ncbi:MAG TPA: alpha/beta hydrolase [Thermoleophilaceae bacterium]|nr:alpha/beta hydrolase [Thermoleophilaceae bacterium]
MDQIVDEALVPHQQSVGGLPSAGRRLPLARYGRPPFGDRRADTRLSGEFDLILPTRFGRSVAAGVPNAHFEVMPDEAHQPFQEVPDEFNARVDAFWREVEAGG